LCSKSDKFGVGALFVVFWLNLMSKICEIQPYICSQISRQFCAMPRTPGGPYWSNINCQQVSVQVRGRHTCYGNCNVSASADDADDDAKTDWFTDTDVLHDQLHSHPPLLLLIILQDRSLTWVRPSTSNNNFLDHLLLLVTANESVYAIVLHKFGSKHKDIHTFREAYEDIQAFGSLSCCVINSIGVWRNYNRQISAI